VDYRSSFSIMGNQCTGEHQSSTLVDQEFSPQQNVEQNAPVLLGRANRMNKRSSEPTKMKEDKERPAFRKQKSLPVRTKDDHEAMCPAEALQEMKDGNTRYCDGTVEAKFVCPNTRAALKEQGQRPLASVLGCADSRVALDYIFDTNPGDLFVVRNAGNVCGDKSGGIIGSIEYSVEHLETQLLVVLGHTGCGAVAAATQVQLANSGGEGLSDCLKALLERLEKPVNEAINSSNSNEVSQMVELGIQLNVWHTIEELLRASSTLKAAVLAGKLEIHGGVYCLENGHVNWMGQHPEQSKLLDGSDGVLCGACVN